jgi:hypothetical protein
MLLLPKVGLCRFELSNELTDSTRKTNIHVNDAAYQEWLGSTYVLGGPPAADREEKKTESEIDTASVRDTGASEQDAPFPKSFADVVELITSGKPIPGIKEIPDVVLRAPANAATVPPRKKPWEVAKSIPTA